jgi:peroxiredoxin
MKFFAAMLIAGALLLPFLALSAHADSIPVGIHAAPALQSGVWVNGQPTTIAAQRGKVVVLLFWTRGCINCKHNLGYWNDWARRYRGTDVSVLSVHTPETPGERSVSGVRRFVRERGLQFPVLIDNASQTWDAFGVSS